MNDVNHTVITGNLCADPELRYTPSGTAKVRFRIAVNRYAGKDDKGKAQERASFVQCQAWGKLAEITAQYCAKGRRILVAGEIRTEHWDDKKSGDKRSMTLVNANQVQFLGAPKGNASHAPDNDEEHAPDEADEKTGRNTRKKRRK